MGSFQRCRFLSFSLFVATVLSCAGCGRPPAVKETRMLMGTMVEVTVVGVPRPEATAIMDEVWEEVLKIERLMSKYHPESEVSRINGEAFEKPVPVSGGTMEVLGRAADISRMTGGAFDITVGPLMRAWGFFPERKGRIPEDAEIEEALGRIGWESVVLDPEKGTVRLQKPGMEIDLAALAKGYIADRISDLLRQRGVKSALINAGGDLYCLGERPGGGPWRIGVEHPREEGKMLRGLELEDRAVASSGDYRNYFISRSRRRYGHIIDPRTGRPARTGVVETTVVAPDCMTADALATAIFVLGEKKGLDLLESLDGVEGILVSESDGEIGLHSTSGLMD